MAEGGDSNPECAGDQTNYNGGGIMTLHAGLPGCITTFA